MSDEVTLDCRGMRCPLPVIELAKRIGDVPVDGVIRVIADDPAAAADIPAWCRMRGHEYLGQEHSGYASARQREAGSQHAGKHDSGPHDAGSEHAGRDGTGRQHAGHGDTGQPNAPGEPAGREQSTAIGYLVRRRP